MSGNNHFERWVTVSKQYGDKGKKINNTLPLLEEFISYTSVWPLYDKTKPSKQEKSKIKTPTLKLEVGFVLCRKDDGSL